MEIFRAIVLGIVQGLTEFLPISSSAHLIIFPWLFDWEPFGLAFDVAVHIGTLVAVIIYFWRDLVNIAHGTWSSLKSLLRREQLNDPMGKLGFFIAIGMIPAAVVGIFAASLIDRYFHTEPVTDSAILWIAFFLILFGLILGLADWLASARPASSDLESVGWRHSISIGVMQALALIPGVSRSGVTISAGLFTGLDRATAARYSFLLGAPLIFGAGLLQAVDLARDGFPTDQIGIFIAGMLSAAIVGYLAIAGLIRFLQRRSTSVFVGYRLVFGLLLIVLVIVT